MQKFFVTGTDTGAGKTLVSCALLLAAAQRGYSTLGLKPVAAGAVEYGGRQLNEDVLMLRNCSSTEVPWESSNPVLLQQPASPHIAAAAEGRSLSVAETVSSLHSGALGYGAEFLLCEGAGGWLVPLNQRETMADLAVALGFPILLVVSLRLGCLNHSLLSVASIIAHGMELAGWIGTCAEAVTMDSIEENVTTLKEKISAPCLGIVPRLESVPADPLEATPYIDLEPLL